MYWYSCRVAGELMMQHLILTLLPGTFCTAANQDKLHFESRAELSSAKDLLLSCSVITCVEGGSADLIRQLTPCRIEGMGGSCDNSRCCRVGAACSSTGFACKVLGQCIAQDTCCVSAMVAFRNVIYCASLVCTNWLQVTENAVQGDLCCSPSHGLAPSKGIVNDSLIPGQIFCQRLCDCSLSSKLCL